ncbi:hypothetical protein GCM10023212_32390 [Luteolibacter yonseiensis]
MPSEGTGRIENMNFLGPIAIGLGIGGFAISHHHFRSQPQRTKFAGFLILGILSIPALLFAAYYLHILPEKAWFYTLRSWKGSELLAFSSARPQERSPLCCPAFHTSFPWGWRWQSSSLLI